MSVKLYCQCKKGRYMVLARKEHRLRGRGIDYGHLTKALLFTRK